MIRKRQLKLSYNSKQSHWWEDKLFNLREAVVGSVHQIKRFTAHMSLSQIKCLCDNTRQNSLETQSSFRIN